MTVLTFRPVAVIYRRLAHLVSPGPLSVRDGEILNATTGAGQILHSLSLRAGVNL